MNRRTITLSCIAAALAAAAFWATILTDPPVTEAATTSVVDALQRAAPLDLPSLEADAN